jgi:hypothetical protein
LEFEREKWELRWKKEKPTGPEFDQERRRFCEAQIDEMHTDINRLLEIQEPRWEAEFDEEIADD